MMRDNIVDVNSARAWFLAARPKTLTAAAVPVMLGVAAHETDGLCALDPIPVILCFLFAFILQVDANFVNDYFDYVKGTDGEERLGPKRACAQGWITLPAMRMGIMATTALGCLAGLPLIYYGGGGMVLIGIACVVFCFLYTTCLSYMGLGDVLVLVFFGLVPVCATYYVTSVSCEGIPVPVILLSLACGLVVDTLLIVNNYRDIENDRRAGKVTLVVRIGKRASERLYLLLGVSACVLGVLAPGRQWSVAMGLPLLYLIPHVRTYNQMIRIGEGRALNAVLGKTARNIFLFGLLETVALLTAEWLHG